MIAAITTVDSGAQDAPVAPRLLGRGRSGEVFLVSSSRGPEALKVFGSSGLTKVVQHLLLGAPNPYQWNADAIACAELRRRILVPLVHHWFGRRLRVAAAYGHHFDPKRRTYALSTEFSSGRAPRLRHPLDSALDCAAQDEARYLEQDILEPLRARLADAGFDGLLWQAGLGNPVALNNFLIEDRADGHEPRITWIDLESGVPALFPWSPKALASFYLPRAWQLRRPLFDDVDIARLRDHVRAATSLRRKLGEPSYLELCSDIEALASAQTAWKTQPRAARSVAYRLSLGQIDQKQAAYYSAHGFQWYVREVLRAAYRLPNVAWSTAITLTLWVLARARSVVEHTVRSAWSSRHRTALARHYVAGRIEAWSDRGQLAPHQAAELSIGLQERDASTHLADFGVHLAIKPAVKIAQFVVSPVLLVAGIIDETTLGLIWASGGVLGRTAYTAARTMQATVHGRKRPWMALAIGLLPVVGTFAFLVQMLHAARSQSAIGARFILVDAFTRLGEHLPIWGGRDTTTEHVFNRIGMAVFATKRAPSPNSPSPSPLPEGPAC